jgi:hypothetical protein
MAIFLIIGISSISLWTLETGDVDGAYERLPSAADLAGQPNRHVLLAGYSRVNIR